MNWINNLKIGRIKRIRKNRITKLRRKKNEIY